MHCALAANAAVDGVVDDDSDVDDVAVDVSDDNVVDDVDCDDVVYVFVAATVTAANDVEDDGDDDVQCIAATVRNVA